MLRFNGISLSFLTHGVFMLFSMKHTIYVLKLTTCFLASVFIKIVAHFFVIHDSAWSTNFVCC